MRVVYVCEAAQATDFANKPVERVDLALAKGEPQPWRTTARDDHIAIMLLSPLDFGHFQPGDRIVVDIYKESDGPAR